MTNNFFVRNTFAFVLHLVSPGLRLNINQMLESILTKKLQKQ